MKNACIVLKKSVNAAPDAGVNAVLDELFLGGYALDEIRFLPQSDEKKVIHALTALKTEYDNIFVLVEKTTLPVAKSYLSTEGQSAQAYAEFANAVVYDGKKSSLLLCSTDQTETGTQYIRNACIPFLQKKYGLRFDKIVLRAVGAISAHVEQTLSEAKRMGGNAISCAHTRKYDEDIVEITYDSNTPKMLADDVLRMLAEGFGDTIYALDNTTRENQLVSLLKVRGKRLSVAESFTGGGVARRIVSVPGASEVYFEGLNTYNEGSKIKRLGVSPYPLGTVGAVSEKTAYEMALGLLNTGDCDIAVSTTGLAGPKSDRSNLPVGYCCIAVGTKERICVYQYKFDGSREEITEKAINYALFLAYRQLKNI